MTGTNPKRILVLDDDADFRNLLRTYLNKQFEGTEVEEHDPLADGVPGEDFEWSRYEVMVLDYNLSIPDVTGLDILQANRHNQLFPATIMLTGAGNEEVAVRALKSGVFDYLRKEKLDKEELHDAIVDAYEKLGSRQERLNEFTNQSQAFNKALFYQQLEEHQQQRGGLDRVLLFISLDNHQEIGEKAGLILRDNIIRHIAKQTYNFFQLDKCNPIITRLSDTTVALLIDEAGTDNTLKKNLQGLCDHLKKRPYEYEGTKYRFTASIGVVRLHDHVGSAESVIQVARQSCTLAEKQENNSFYLYKADTDSSKGPVESTQTSLKEPADTKTTQKDRGAEKTADADREQVTSTSAPPPPTSPPQEKPADAAAEAKPQKAALDDGELEEADLSEDALVVKRAFDEKRIMQTFQSVIPLFSAEEADTEEGEAYYASLEMLNPDSSVSEAGEIFKAANKPAFRKYIDRWMLREAIGRVINSSRPYLFLIPLSKDSLADPSLFNWLRVMLAGFDQRRPGQAIALEIKAADFTALQKPASALISYLAKTHGFKFVLGNVNKDHDLIGLCELGDFNIIRADHQLLINLSESPYEGEEDGKSVVSFLKAKGIRFIADNIEDAMALTTVIGTGADYARGTFIGEPGEQLDDQTNIESVEIV